MLRSKSSHNFQELLTTKETKPLSLSPTEMNDLMVAISTPSLSHIETMKLLRKQQEKIIHLKKLLHNHYSKFSKHSKRHQLNISKYEAEIAHLKSVNEQLLAEKSALEKAMACKDEILQKAIYVCQLLNFMRPKQ